MIDLRATREKERSSCDRDIASAMIAGAAPFLDNPERSRGRLQDRVGVFTRIEELPSAPRNRHSSIDSASAHPSSHLFLALGVRVVFTAAECLGNNAITFSSFYPIIPSCCPSFFILTCTHVQRCYFFFFFRWRLKVSLGRFRFTGIVFVTFTF